ncbi:MAG TPA: 3'(2'),5'-bisphosphate nucleotidase CysQ [Microthrixaceae bacterium]|nr:3'(2'),5'-bisphosphate nucleotidase CysQ [Microthrixaceae bacterium]
MTPASSDDHELARQLATEAGALLVELRARMVADGADPREMKDEGDRRSHDLLTERLAAARPADAVLSEEDRPDAVLDAPHPPRLDSSRVWIIDPLDGTREFGEPPRHDWAVHVALCIDGLPVAGAVALPALGETLSTAEPPTLTTAAHDPLRVLVSRTRPPAEALSVARSIDAQLVEMGSAGAKAMAVVRGEADAYPHSGGQYEWDSCAPVAVALAAGAWCSRLDGTPLAYNRPDPYLPDLLICRPELAERILATLHHG